MSSPSSPSAVVEDLPTPTTPSVSTSVVGTSVVGSNVALSSEGGKFYFRQPARNLYVRRRHEALTSHQQVEARELREAIMILSSAKKYHKIKPGVQQKIEMVLTTLVKRYLGI
ncbi:hypothetical protein B484DRAFT_389237, partial [Ochromonadaceae sp. CCMP2298]